MFTSPSQSRKAAQKAAIDLETFFGEQKAYSRPSSVTVTPRKADDRFLKQINETRTVKASRLFKKSDVAPSDDESSETSDLPRKSSENPKAKMIKVLQARKVAVAADDRLTVDVRKGAERKLRPKVPTKEMTVEIPGHPSTSNLLMYQPKREMDVVLVGQKVLEKEPLQEVRETSKKLSDTGDSLIVKAAKLLEDKAKLEEIEKRRLREMERRFKPDEDEDLSFADKVIQRYQKALEQKQRQIAESSDAKKHDFAIPDPKAVNLRRVASALINNILQEVEILEDRALQYPKISAKIVDDIMYQVLSPLSETHAADAKELDLEVKSEKSQSKSMSYIDLARINLQKLAPTYAAHLASLDRQRDSIMQRVRELPLNSDQAAGINATQNGKRRSRFVGASQAIPFTVSYFGHLDQAISSNLHEEMNQYVLVHKIADLKRDERPKSRKVLSLDHQKDRQDAIHYLLNAEKDIKESGKMPATSHGKTIQGTEFQAYSDSYYFRDDTPVAEIEVIEHSDIDRSVPHSRARSPFAKPRICETSHIMALNELNSESRSPFPLPSSYGERYMLIPEQESAKPIEENPLATIFSHTETFRPLSQQYITRDPSPETLNPGTPFKVRHIELSEKPVVVPVQRSWQPEEMTKSAIILEAANLQSTPSLDGELLDKLMEVTIKGKGMSMHSRDTSPTRMIPISWTPAPSRIEAKGAAEERIEIQNEAEPSMLAGVNALDEGIEPLPDILHLSYTNPMEKRMEEIDLISRENTVERRNIGSARSRFMAESNLDSVTRNIDFLVKKHQSFSKSVKNIRSNSPTEKEKGARSSSPTDKQKSIRSLSPAEKQKIIHDQIASLIHNQSNRNISEDSQSDFNKSNLSMTIDPSRPNSAVSDIVSVKKSIERVGQTPTRGFKRYNTVGGTTNPTIMESLTNENPSFMSVREEGTKTMELAPTSQEKFLSSSNSLMAAPAPVQRKKSITSISIKKVIGLKKSDEVEAPVKPKTPFEEDEETLNRVEAQLKSSEGNEVELLLTKTKILVKRRNFDNIANDMTHVINIDPHNIEAYWLRYLAFMEGKKYEPALKDLDKILTYNRQHVNAHLAKAEVYEATGKTKLAINALNNVIRIKPNEAIYHLKRGILLEADHEVVMAAEDFKTATNLDPKNTDAALKYGMYCFSRQFWEDAIKYFERALDSKETCVTALCYRTKCNSQMSKWDDAFRDISQAIQKDPNNPEVFLLRGCLERVRNPRKAIKDLSVSIILDSSDDNVEAFIQRAAVYNSLGFSELAIKDYLKVISANEMNYIPYLNIANISLFKLKNYNQAMTFINEAIRIEPTNVKCHLIRARIYEELYHKMRYGPKKIEPQYEELHKMDNCLNEAIRDYGRAIYLDPQNFSNYLHHGKLLLMKRMVKEARYDFATMFKLKPDLTSNITNRTTFNLFTGKYDQIFEDFAKYNGKITSANYLLQARAKMKQCKFQDAYEILSTASKADKRNALLFLNQGICLEYLQRYPEAIEKLTNCLEFDKSNEEAFYHRGRCKFFMGQERGVNDITKAIKCSEHFVEPFLTRAAYFLSTDRDKWVLGISDCNDALKIDPKCIRAHILRGLLKYSLNQKGFALNDFSEAIKIDPNCITAYYNRGVVHQAMENVKDAMIDYSICLLIDDQAPIVASVFRNRALIYWKNDKPDYALSDLYYAREKFPNEANLHALLGLTLQKLSRYTESLDSYNIALRLNPYLLDIYLGRGNVNIALRDVEAAKVSYQNAIRMSPSFVSAYINLAYALQLQNRYKQAWSVLCAAIAIDPNRWEAYEGRAIIHMLLKNNYAALYDISKALEISPRNPAILTNQGVIHQNCGNLTNALRDFLDAIEIDKNYSVAHFNAGNLFFHQKQYDRAMECFNKCIEISPKDESCYLNRGICNAVMKKFDDALSDFAAVISLAPNNSHVYFNRAQLYLQRGMNAEAEADFLKVLSIEPRDSLTQLRLGDALGRQSRLAEAMDHYAVVEDHHL